MPMLVSRGTTTIAVLLTFAVVIACGKPEAPEEAPASASQPIAADTIVRAERPDTVGRGPVTLPEEFPSDFPIPPGSTLIEASAIPEGNGTSSRIALVGAGPVGDTVEWYESALRAAGWQVTARDSLDGGVTVSAIQGESYAALELRPEPPVAAGERLRIRARIWSTGP